MGLALVSVLVWWLVSLWSLNLGLVLLLWWNYLGHYRK
jgi:hypothetical protein